MAQTLKKLFEYVILKHNYKEEEGKEPFYLDTELIEGPLTMLAKTEKEVMFKLTKELAPQHSANPDNIEFVIRNF